VDAEVLRELFKTAVLNNAIRRETLWGQRCHAYNVQFQPDLIACRSLSKLQDWFLQLEPSLLQVPVHAMHISVARLLDVRQLYPSDERILWRRHGSAWLAELARIAAASRPFPLTYRSIAATDTAVVAVAEPVECMDQIRLEIARTLRLPAEIQNRADLVHTTLFRYSGLLGNPSGFVRATEEAELAIDMTADTLILCREEVFPSLKTTAIGQFPLGSVGLDAERPT
jgi:hypothetical protein